MPISFSLFQYQKKLGRAYEKVNKTFQWEEQAIILQMVTN